jgi:hypothetical protein
VKAKKHSFTLPVTLVSRPVIKAPLPFPPEISPAVKKEKTQFSSKRFYSLKDWAELVVCVAFSFGFIWVVEFFKEEITLGVSLFFVSGFALWLFKIFFFPDEEDGWFFPFGGLPPS